MAVETSPNPRNARKSATGKSAPGKPDVPSRPDVPGKPDAPGRSDKAARTDSVGKRAAGTTLIDAQRRRELIAEAAYFRAERRGFEPGYEAEDWLAAELEIDRALAIGVSPSFKPAVQ
ncbi:MAG TPA: DUF2934 domain-containing protein [Steroidobacteraceae bacterium]|jgi:hypothetical protein|nr:DUF2934 domain-containing protein [Steroidobacteraceae bacterium]